MDNEYRKYLDDVVGTSAIPGWARDYAKQMLLALLEEEIVVHRIVSSGIHSPGPDGNGVLTITVDCFDLENEYLGTGRWIYDHTLASDPTAYHWELQEIELEEKER